MKKLLPFAIILIILVSCDSHLNQSIFTPLSIDDLSKSIKKDTAFADLYKGIREMCDSKEFGDIEKAKFNDITYKDMFDFYEYVQDTTRFKSIDEKAIAEWKDKYSIYDSKIDSVINYWENYKKSNSLENFVDIELAEIKKEYYSYSGSVRRVNLGFRLTPLKGEIDQLIFSYYIKPKINDNDDYDTYISTLDKTRCLLSKPFKDTVTQYWEANFSNERILKDQTLDSFNRDYNIHIKIEEVRMDGQNKGDMAIPESVNDYIKSESESYKTDIAKELLGKDYLPQYSYLNEKRLEAIKSKFPQVYDFLETVSKKTFK